MTIKEDSPFIFLPLSPAPTLVDKTTSASPPPPSMEVNRPRPIVCPLGACCKGSQYLQQQPQQQSQLITKA